MQLVFTAVHWSSFMVNQSPRPRAPIHIFSPSKLFTPLPPSHHSPPSQLVPVPQSSLVFSGILLLGTFWGYLGWKSVLFRNRKNWYSHVFHVLWFMSFPNQFISADTESSNLMFWFHLNIWILLCFPKSASLSVSEGPLASVARATT